MREQMKLDPREKLQLPMLGTIIPRTVHVSILLACIYFAVFDVAFGSIIPTLVNQDFNASLGDERLEPLKGSVSKDYKRTIIALLQGVSLWLGSIADTLVSPAYLCTASLLWLHVFILDLA